MKALKLIPLAVALAVLLCLPSAQAWPVIHKKAKVTGCLTKGAQPNEYTIAANGTTYDLYPKTSLHMARLVGHQVKVTGKLARMSGGKNTASRTAAERVDVTHYKDLGSSCR